MTIDLTPLTDDGDTLDLGDGRILRLAVEPDFVTTLDDYECYGRISEGRYNPDTGRHERPRDFDGNAERINTIFGPCWWQPPVDVARATSGFALLRNTVSDIASYGFRVVTLEYADGVDAYGHPVVRHFTNTGGIEPFTTADEIRFIVSDLWAELEYDIKQTGAVR